MFYSTELPNISVIYYHTHFFSIPHGEFTNLSDPWQPKLLLATLYRFDYLRTSGCGQNASTLIGLACKMGAV